MTADKSVTTAETSAFSITVVYDGWVGDAHDAVERIFHMALAQLEAANVEFDTTRGEKPITCEATHTRAMSQKVSITKMEDF